MTALVAADVHFTSGDLLDVGFQSFVIRTGFEGKDVPHRDGVRDGAMALVPDEVPFEGLLLGLTTPATDADFPGEFQTRMRPDLAASKKGKRFASQNSVWLMSSASKPRVVGGEASVKPRSETVGVSFFHELAVHAFFRLVKAPPEIDRHGSGTFADQLAAHMDAAMTSESTDAMLTRLVEEAGAF